MHLRKTLSSLVLILFLSSFTLIQSDQNTYDMPVDEKTGKITYTDVVKESGTSAELYDRAYAWAKKYFVNISSTIKKRSKSEGVLSGVTHFKVTSTDKKGKKVSAGSIMYTFTIDFKDGKYRLVQTSFEQAHNTGKPVEEWFKDTNEKAMAIHKEIFQQIDAEAKRMSKSLKAAMKPVKESSDEW
jgi:hypothetical protein